MEYLMNSDTESDQKKPEASQDKPTCVVIDTNIWRSTLLLRQGLGPAFLHTLYLCEGKLGLPQIVKLEIHNVLFEMGLDSIRNIERGFREISAILGQNRPYRAPSHQQLRDAINNRIQELDELVKHVPMNLEHYQAATERVVAGLPPNRPQKQQYKDSMIWEAVLELGRSYIVHFVSKDKSFFKDKDYRTLNPILREECKRAKVEVCLYWELADCLKVLRTDAPELDDSVLAQAIIDEASEALTTSATSRDLVIGPLKNHKISQFYTQVHNELGLHFELSFEAYEIDPDRENLRFNPIITARGDCKYNVNSGRAAQVQFDEIEFSWSDESGERSVGRAVFLRVSDCIQTQSIGTSSR